MSDNFESKLGKRKPFMLVGMAILIVFLIGMAFTTPNSEIYAGTSDKLRCGLTLEERRCVHYLKIVDPSNFPVKRSNIQSKELRESYPKIIGFVICYVFVIISHTMVSVPYNGLLADFTPSSRRGFSSGVMGAMTLIGNLTGAGLGLLISYYGIFGFYFTLASINLVCIVLTTISIPNEPPTYRNMNDDWKDEKNLNEKNICDQFSLAKKTKNKKIGDDSWIKSYYEPLRDSNFRWVFITRLFMQLGVSTITSFLEFWLGDMVELPYCWSAEKAVTLLLIPLLLSSAIFSIIGGHYSDKLKKRKPLVIGSAILMSACMLILSVLRGWYAYLASLVVAVVIGIGFGSYSAIDFALVIDVLNKRASKAKDLAVWHQALIIPQCIAAPFGGLVLDVFQALDCKNGIGYIILFLLTSFYFFMGGVLVMKIKNVN